MNADSTPNQNQGISESNPEATKQMSVDTSMSGGNQSEQAGGSNRLTLDSLPQDVKDSLPQEAQGIFVAAYNSFLDNSHDQEAAKRIAWQTIERNEHYARGEDGKWYRLPDASASYHGGLSSMPGG